MIILRKIRFTEPNFCRGFECPRFFGMGSASVLDSYSISKSIVSRRRAADSAVARQGEGNNDTIDFEMELKCIDFVILVMSNI